MAPFPEEDIISPARDSMETSTEHLIVDVRSAAAGGGAGEVPPPRSLTFLLSFTDLSYTVKVPRKMTFPTKIFRRSNKVSGDINGRLLNGENSNSRTKVLLDEISGEARDGEILAVLGASGSGKSTLIDALANRISRASLRGKITLNNESIDPQMLKVISAYVMQDDLLYPMLTVEETLMFAAEFRLPRNLSKSKKQLRVRALIDQLGLQNASKTIIGDEGHRGISGGERRRVSIGVDIIHDPIVLFLDEPTSGLDSTSAFSVIRILRGIAQTGSIVIMSIHQPSNRILRLLDRLLILSRGEAVYGGLTESLPEFFREFGCPIPADENRIEFALDLIRELEDKPEGTKPLVEFNRNWQRNRSTPAVMTPLSLTEAINLSISRGKLVSGSAGDPTTKVSMVPVYANPVWTEIIVLTKRSFTNERRMPEIFLTRLAAIVVTGLLLATVFWRLDNTPKGVQERLGFIAFTLTTSFYMSVDALPVFLQERYIFIRETAYNAYRRVSYVLSHALATFPPLVLLALAFSGITFWSVGLAGGAWGFLFYLAIMLASFWGGNSFVTFLSGFIPNVILGFVVSVAVLAYFLLLSGYFINRDRIPVYWIWFHYISLVKYPYEGVLKNEFTNSDRCFGRAIEMFDNTPIKAAPEALKERLLEVISDTLKVNITGDTCTMTGEDVLDMQGVTHELSKWNCLLITIAWGVFFRVLFYFCLMIGSKNKRK